MKKEEIKEKIIAYIKAAYQWHTEDEPSCEKGIGLKMVTLEEEILTSFGLPETAFQYSEILQLYGFSDEDLEENAEELYEKLHQAAVAFLLTPAENNTAILKNGKENLLDAQEVLPLIGFLTTKYAIFIYHDIYWRGLCNEQELIDALQKADKFEKPFENNLSSTYSDLKKRKCFKEMKEAGLPYAEEYKKYLKYAESKQDWDKVFDNKKLKKKPKLGEEFLLTELHITKVFVKDASTAVIVILLPFKKSFLVLSIWCNTIMLRNILHHSKYLSLCTHLYLSVKPDYLRDNSFSYDFIEQMGKALEIENIDLKIHLTEWYKKKVKYPYDYSITSLNYNSPIPEEKELEDDLPF